jgi:hypothetical protein
LSQTSWTRYLYSKWFYVSSRRIYDLLDDWNYLKNIDRTSTWILLLFIKKLELSLYITSWTRYLYSKWVYVSFRGIYNLLDDWNYLKNIDRTSTWILLLFIKKSELSLSQTSWTQYLYSKWVYVSFRGIYDLLDDWSYLKNIDRTSTWRLSLFIKKKLELSLSQIS